MSIPFDGVKALDMRSKTVAHDRNQFGMDFVLMFLVVALELVELN